ncbi:MAG: SDR family NAD(P)-dependent oxidoreductase [Calditrichaeota bacterium]|nr:SDR family NAD(P)-dependent oxidoreductase [Calditrichota bacterium]
MSKIALITGATAGIGKATAELFAKNGIDLILCGRRKERLDELRQTLGESVKVTTLSFDVRNREAVFAAIDSLPDHWKSIDILVNNAGNAHGLDTVQNANIDDWDAMIDGNVKGLLYVTRAVLPGMIAKNDGHIVNIGSIAGEQVYSKGAVYCASKFAVDALSQGMRLDLLDHNIRVTNIAPGLVETEFSLVRFKGDANKADQVYKGLDALTGADIAEAIFWSISRPAHVQIADMLILPSAQAAATTVRRK